MGAPKPPDPVKTAEAQFTYGKQAAQYNQEINQTNQVTPEGSLTYQQIGTNPDGSPRYQATTAYNPQTQALMDAQTGAQTKAAGLAGNLLDQNSAAITAGPDLGPSIDETGITKNLMNLGEQYYQPIFDHQRAALDAKLANQGIAQGSEAYNNAINLADRDQSDAYTKLLLSGQDTAINAFNSNANTALAKYRAPLDALAALSGSSPPASISFAQTPQASVQAPDYTSLVEQNYQQKMQNRQNLLSGLFAIPKTLLGGWGAMAR